MVISFLGVEVLREPGGTGILRVHLSLPGESLPGQFRGPETEWGILKQMGMAASVSITSYLASTVCVDLYG